MDATINTAVPANIMEFTIPRNNEKIYKHHKKSFWFLYRQFCLCTSYIDVVYTVELSLSEGTLTCSQMRNSTLAVLMGDVKVVNGNCIYKYIVLIKYISGFPKTRN